MKSTSFFPSSKSCGTDEKIDSPSTKSTSVSTGVSTQSAGVSTQSAGVSTQNTGVSTQSTGVSTQSAGVSTQNAGVSTKNAGVSTQSTGVSTQSFGTPTQNRISLNKNSGNISTTVNSNVIIQEMNGSTRFLESSTELNTTTVQTNGSAPGRATFSDNQSNKEDLPSNLKRTARTRSKEGKRRLKRTSDDKNDPEKASNKNNAPHVINKKRVAWADVVDNNQGNENELVKQKDDPQGKTQKQIEDEIIVKKKKEEGAILKSQRLEQMRVREKRAEYRK